MPRIINVGVVRAGQRLEEKTLKPSEQDLIRRRLPAAWQKAVINIDRFNALKVANADLEAKMSTVREGVTHLILEMGGELKLLSIEEIAKLDSEGIDEAAMVSQLTP